MAIKYEIHYLPNAGGNEEIRRFAHIFEQPAMTDKQMIERIAQHSCLGKGEVATVFMQLREPSLIRKPDFSSCFNQLRAVCLRI